MIYEAIDFSTEDEHYSVITKNEQGFEIVSNSETWRFKIHVQ